MSNKRFICTFGSSLRGALGSPVRCEFGSCLRGASRSDADIHGRYPDVSTKRTGRLRYAYQY